MPAKGFQYYSVEAFPDLPIGDSIETEYQGSLIKDLVGFPHVRVDGWQLMIER